MRILVLNVGSSSLKASLYEDGPRPVSNQQLNWTEPAEALNGVGKLLESLQDRAIDVVGHRVVHGGRAFRDSVRITPQVRAAIAKVTELAPEHNRLELRCIEIAERIFGSDVPQVAVFDTAFHATLPPDAYVYPGPYDWLDLGIRRYGFHGISHQYVSRRAAEVLGRLLQDLNLITCHLGNGCSLAAIRAGQSVDTTMGFTPLEGLMMGTRSGSVDPGIVIHLLRHGGHSPEEVDRLLNEGSGLKGVSGISGDMRKVLAAMAAGDNRARLAFDIYVHRLRAGIGSMLANLGALDAIVFTAGVGENSPEVRAAVCNGLRHFGLELDESRNTSGNGDRDITAPESAARILVIRTEEDWEIARECRRLLTDQV